MSAIRAGRVPTGWADLSEQLDGRLYLPGDQDWNAVRQGWNLTADQRPAAVVVAAGPADVAPVVRYARRAGLRVAVQGTGHAAVAGSLEQAILVKTSRMRGL